MAPIFHRITTTEYGRVNVSFDMITFAAGKWMWTQGNDANEYFEKDAHKSISDSKLLINWQNKERVGSIKCQKNKYSCC